MPSTTSIRDHLAAALHADRDHTRDGVQLGSEPICNCYPLADVAIAALGGVKVTRTLRRRPNHIQERITFASDWHDVSGSTVDLPSTLHEGVSEL